MKRHGVRQTVTLPRLIRMVVYLCSLFSWSLSAQSDSEHESHHPEIYGQPMDNKGAAVQGTSQSLQGGPAKGMGKGMGKGMAGMMDEMMEKMGAPKPRDLYPTLMRLDPMDTEQTAMVSQQASERMVQGTQMMLDGFNALQQASQSTAYDKMQAAIMVIDEGLARYDSGLAAHRAVAEGQAPQRVALKWFKGQMNLLPSPVAEKRTILWGMSGLHTGVMVVLILFSITLFSMYFYKMRRAASLMRELSQTNNRNNAAPQADKIAATDDTPLVAPTTAAPQTEKVAETRRTEVRAGPYSGPLTVTGIFRETHDVKTFRLTNGTGGVMPFTFEPGQFVTFILDIPGQSKPVRRSYTIASSPTERDYIEVTIKREEHGLVSRFMHDQVKRHDILNVKVPGGRFYFNGENKNSVVLISGGVGITPMMSAVRYLTTRCWSGEIYFLFCTRSTRDFIFEQELTYLQQRFTNLHVLVSMTRAEGTSWMGPQGRFSSRQIAEFVPNIQDRDCHICGPVPMMDAIKAMLQELKVPSDQIKTEAFGPVKAPASLENEMSADESGQEQSTGHQVNFTVSNKTMICPPDQTLLEAAEAVDIEIENSCRAGSCGSCMVRLQEGDVSMEVDDALTEQEKNQGFVLACQAIPKTSVKVEI